MKRALVTGASGLIGRHVIGPLVARGFEVHASCRRPPQASAHTIWHAADLLQPGEPERLASAVKASHLLHLAWVTGPSSRWTSPENEQWVDASLALLRAFREEGGDRALPAGSCAEYAPSDEPCSEARTPVQPRTPYGSAKDRLHKRAAALARESGLSLAWARLFFLYGPGEDVSRLVPSVARALLVGEPAPMTSGEQLRDFLYVAEVAEALAAVLDGEVEGALNVASGRSVSVREVAETVASIAGKAELLRRGELERPADDPDVLVADVTRLRTEVGWQSTIELEEGIARTVDWWRTRLG